MGLEDAPMLLLVKNTHVHLPIGAPDPKAGAMTGRLVTSFWVQAYLTRLRLRDIQGFVVAHGDNDAGAVLVKINTLDGRAAALQRGFDLETGARHWVELLAGDESEVDQAIQRQRGFDSDIWVIEVEDRQGRHLLDEDGLSD